jgi:8-oxo-dGTP pyrophosphatase MutT (NUDIX family)
VIIEEMYQQIEHKLTRLLARTTGTDWVDIVDEKNAPLGFRLPVTWADKHGLWYRGCHAIITTADKKVIVERRATHRRFMRGYLDISLCGVASSEEDPEQAMLREVEEGLGLAMVASSLQLLAVYKWHNYHPRYRTYKNMFIYTYHIALPVNEPKLTFQKSEVAKVRLLNTPALRRLLRRHQLRPFGKLQYAYAYYTSMVQLTEELDVAVIPNA